MYKLFYADGSASMGIQVILEEIGVAYELIQSTIDMNKPVSYTHLTLPTRCLV